MMFSSVSKINKSFLILILSCLSCSNAKPILLVGPQEESGQLPHLMRRLSPAQAGSPSGHFPAACVSPNPRCVFGEVRGAALICLLGTRGRSRTADPG